MPKIPIFLVTLLIQRIQRVQLPKELKEEAENRFGNGYGRQVLRQASAHSHRAGRSTECW